MLRCAILLLAAAAAVEGMQLTTMRKYTASVHGRRTAAPVCMGALWNRSKKYGEDPRKSADLVEAGEIGDFSVAAPGEIGQISNVAQLDAALSPDQAPVVVLKFIRQGCPACASTAAQLEAAAKTYRNDARVYLVDYEACKAFCKLCRIKVVPVKLQTKIEPCRLLVWLASLAFAVPAVPSAVPSLSLFLTSSVRVSTLERSGRRFTCTLRDR
jgi:thiol-disulfide isomerase/thioredoxin